MVSCSFCFTRKRLKTTVAQRGEPHGIQAGPGAAAAGVTSDLVEWPGVPTSQARRGGKIMKCLLLRNQLKTEA